MCELPWICPSPSDSLLTADTARYRTKTRLDASCSEVGQHNNRQDERTSRKRYPDDMFTGPDAPETRGRLLPNVSAVQGTIVFLSRRYHPHPITVHFLCAYPSRTSWSRWSENSGLRWASHVAVIQGPLSRYCHTDRRRLDWGPLAQTVDRSLLASNYPDVPSPLPRRRVLQLHSDFGLRVFLAEQGSLTELC